MFRDRIIEEKKKLNISARSMSERSKLHIPEETISRVLSGKTLDPGVSTALDIADTVGLAPYELFMDSTLAAEFKAFLELKNKSEESEAERIRIIAENESLKSINLGLSDRIMMLEEKIKSQDKLIEVYSRCLELLDKFKTDFK
jgi:transcriptional regulator with XRE-family HTH domain